MNFGHPLYIVRCFKERYNVIVLNLLFYVILIELLSFFMSNKTNHSGQISPKSIYALISLLGKIWECLASLKSKMIY